MLHQRVNVRLGLAAKMTKYEVFILLAQEYKFAFERETASEHLSLRPNDMKPCLTIIAKS